MSFIIEAGKVLGLPGAVLLVWYLIERAKIGEQSKERAERALSESKRTDAITEGFRTLGGLIADHARADLESHAEQTERIARIEGQLQIRRNTPAAGVPTIREINRARTGGNDR